ncbi:hypothetical protein EV122DRAFT_271352 [Schizophyllum commune]
MTTYAQRNQPTSLKERIAALNAGAATQSRAVSPTPGMPVNPQGSLRSKVAQFEQKGPVPAPKTAFGSAAPIPGGPLEPQLTGKSAAPGLGPPPRGAKGARSVSAPFASEPEVPKPPPVPTSTSTSTSPAPSPPETPPKLAKDLRQRSTSFAAALDRARHAEQKAKQREARERSRVTPNHTGTSQGIAPQHTGSSGPMLTPMHTGGSNISWLVPMNTGGNTGSMLSPHVTGGSSFSHPEGAITEDPEEMHQQPVKPPLTTGDGQAIESATPASPKTNGALPSLTTAELPIPTSTSSPADDTSTPKVPNPPPPPSDTRAAPSSRQEKRESQTQYIQVMPPRPPADVPYTPNSSFNIDEEEEAPHTPTRASYVSRSRPMSMLEFESPRSTLGSPGIVQTAERATTSKPLTVQPPPPPVRVRGASHDTPTTPTHRVGRSITLSHTPNFRAQTGERGFRAVVHARVREQSKCMPPPPEPPKPKAAPATTIVSEEVPSTPGLGDLASLLGQAAMLEEQLSAGMLPDENPAPKPEPEQAPKEEEAVMSAPSESEAEPEMVLPVGASIGGRTKRKRTFKNPLAKVGVRRSRTTGSISSVTTEEPVPPLPTVTPATTTPSPEPTLVAPKPVMANAASSSDTLQPPSSPGSAPPTPPPKVSTSTLGRAKTSASTPPSAMPAIDADGHRQRFSTFRSLSTRSSSAFSAIRHSMYVGPSDTSDNASMMSANKSAEFDGSAEGSDLSVAFPRKSTSRAPSVKSHSSGSVRKRFADKIWPGSRNRVKSNVSRAGEESVRATPSIDIVPPKWEEGDMPSFDASDMPSFAAEDLVTSTPPRARRGSGESTATAKARAQPKRMEVPAVVAPATQQGQTAHLAQPDTPQRRQSWASWSSTTTSPSSVSFDPALVDQFPSVPQGMPEGQRTSEEPAPVGTLGLL